MAIAGSVTLLEAVRWGTDVIKQGVTELIIQESPVLEMMPMVTIKGNALKRTLETSLPTVTFRDVNQTYTRDFGTDENVYWGTAILGGEVFVDNYIVNTMGNVADVKARQFAKKAKAAALQFDFSFFKGTGTQKDFKGINQLITEGFGQITFCGAGLASGNYQGGTTDTANGGVLSLDDLDAAQDLLRTGRADAIMCNRFIRRKITRQARYSVTGVALIDVGDDKFGRQVMTYNDIPIRILGQYLDGSFIVDFNETRGSSNLTTSLYMVRFEEDEGVAGLFGADGYFEVKDFGETQAAPGHLGRIEFYPGIMSSSKYSVVRLAGLLQQ